MLVRKLVAEFLGTLFLLATVVGSGIPAASNTVGATSITWWNCVRT